MSDSAQYQQKKQQFDNVLTIYGRKPALEALQNREVAIKRIHLASSNKRAGILDDIIRLAEQRDIDIRYCSKIELSRISKNSRQDQGVAVDLSLPQLCSLNNFVSSQSINNSTRLMLLDGIVNPQNVGMIIRSAAAGGIDAIIIPSKGSADLGPLVIKSSAGAIFRAPIVRCDSVKSALQALKPLDVRFTVLAADGDSKITQPLSTQARCFILGNESEGVSSTAREFADERLSIPMQNQIESLNVAVTAALIAFMT